MTVSTISMINQQFDLNFLIAAINHCEMKQLKLEKKQIHSVEFIRNQLSRTKLSQFVVVCIFATFQIDTEKNKIREEKS